MFTTPCGYIGEQSGHTLSCDHSCLGQIAIGQNATEKQNMPMRQAFLYCTALGIPGHFKPQGRQRCIKANAEVYQLTYKICQGGYNIFEHPEKFIAVLEPRLEILEFVVESYLYTELMVCRVNGTTFPYTREYSQPTNLPAQPTNSILFCFILFYFVLFYFKTYQTLHWKKHKSNQGYIQIQACGTVK